MLEELRTKYDYVLVDTAPTLLVADTTIISKYADIVLYLIKANYTDKQLMSYITDLKDQSKIANPFIVFNNVGQNEGYGKAMHIRISIIMAMAMAMGSILSICRDLKK